MKKSIVCLMVVVAIVLVWLLLTRHQSVADRDAGAQSAEDSATTSAHTAARKQNDDAVPSRLAAAYAPGVVVVTNNVLEPDPRQKFKLYPDATDRDTEEKTRYYNESRNASRQGANGKATFHVVDTDGNSVADAAISASFFSGESTRGLTDADGLFTVSGRTLNGSSLLYRVTKQGFYETWATYKLEKRGYRCLENGRWIPWNPTLRVTLKDIRNPIPMYLRRIDLPMPVQSTPVGFDFEAGDWVAPYGQGIHPDMQLTYVWAKGEGTWTRHDFTIAFSNALDGVYLARQDGFCPLKSTHEADTGETYRKEIQYLFERTDEKIIHDWPQSDSDLFVFRVGTEADSGGKLRRARYGKIYGPFWFAQGPKKHVQFTYFFNPNDNDPNLEFDGANNLSGQIWYGGDVPR